MNKYLMVLVLIAFDLCFSQTGTSSVGGGRGSNPIKVPQFLQEDLKPTLVIDDDQLGDSGPREESHNINYELAKKAYNLITVLNNIKEVSFKCSKKFKVIDPLANATKIADFERVLFKIQLDSLSFAAKVGMAPAKSCDCKEDKIHQFNCLKNDTGLIHKIINSSLNTTHAEFLGVFKYLYKPVVADSEIKRIQTSILSIFTKKLLDGEK